MHVAPRMIMIMVSAMEMVVMGPVVVVWGRGRSCQHIIRAQLQAFEFFGADFDDQI